MGLEEDAMVYQGCRKANAERLAIIPTPARFAAL
jgi:hypothetical protein